MSDNRTPNLNLPLPDPASNKMDFDAARLVTALTMLDAAVAGKASSSDITAEIAALVGGAPSQLNTLKELADALADDANFASTLTAALALKANLSAMAAVALSGNYNDLSNKPTAYTLPIASGGALGGIKIGAGLSIDPVTGVVTATGGAATVTYVDVPVTVSTDGQTTFTVPSGYTVGLIDVIVNGALYVGGGDDYTASNGTSITLTTGITTDDTLIVRKWSLLQIANDVILKTGGAMAGYFGHQKVDKGTVSSGTVTFSASGGNYQKLTVGGSLTLAFSSWPGTGVLQTVIVELTNAGSAVVTMPTINWIKPDGSVTTTFATYLAAIGRPSLQSSGKDFMAVWSTDGGTTLFGKLV